MEVQNSKVVVSLYVNFIGVLRIRPGHTGKKIVKVSCQVYWQTNCTVVQEIVQEYCRIYQETYVYKNLQETCNFVQESCRFVQETCQDVNDMYVYCTVLYCVRYVYVPVNSSTSHD